ncbi:hypothetical protein LOTGIDRAFT_142416 [Lottia gigantea]|uniref:NIF3-like protein 1 n=1 Tax=Lottia gigantea TaxID=225164 RepID=V4A440_LOTGI|nr:hypothetical protein LOTGIDRAFT_142416 [Lottia gigantea]ESO98683.1 hypothetical protein LOTGIDRAFT_142416 [Lottia gigantea]
MELQQVVSNLKTYAPTSLAGSWDNVGLLVEPSAPHIVKTLFLTNDLTPPVLDEAIEKKADMILSYHPPIFSAMKRLRQSVWKERLIVKCIENKIAVYSPHTCFDAKSAGVNDWLISAFELSNLAMLNPVPKIGFGGGRVGKLKTPITVSEAVDRIKTHLQLNHIRLAAKPSNKPIQSVAVCAGSGSSVLRGVRADLYVTGEMSHHDVLDAVYNGANVILCEHSNTERRYLKQVKQELYKTLTDVSIVISDIDTDPLHIV